MSDRKNLGRKVKRQCYKEIYEENESISPATNFDEKMNEDPKECDNESFLL
mgnify:CR=1 FL=1